MNLYAIDNPITQTEHPIYSIQNVRTFAYQSTDICILSKVSIKSRT